jgi:phosphohistidine phosphatase SixA
MAQITFVFGRHGNASSIDPSVTDQRLADQARPLSDKGRRQAKNTGNVLAAAFPGLVFDVVIASDGLRAIETIATVTNTPQDEVIIVPELYMPDGEDGDTLEKMFGELRYNTTTAYLKHPLAATRCLSRYANSAAAAILSKLRVTSLTHLDEGTVIAIGGHAICNTLGAAALLRTLPNAEAVATIVENLDFKEAGIVVVTADITGVQPMNIEFVYNPTG